VRQILATGTVISVSSYSTAEMVRHCL